VTPHDLIAAVVVTILTVAALVYGWVTVLVSDPVLVSAVSATGALLVSIVGVIGTLLARRDTRDARATVESIHHQVADNGHRDPDNPTLKDYLGKVEQRLDAQDEATAEQGLVMARLAGEVRRHMAFSEDFVERDDRRHDRMEQRLAQLERQQEDS